MTDNDSNYSVIESSALCLSGGMISYRSKAFTPVDSVIQSKIELEDFWKLESIGIVDKPVASDDDLAMGQFRRNLTFEEGRYYVTWPWKETEPDLPRNKKLAVGRLRSSINRMKHKPDLLEKYDGVIKDQLKKGIVECVDADHFDGLVHYIPHHAVITPQKTTTKPRVVYDASAKTKTTHKSLNECLYRGPVMLHDLCGMLLRFRTHIIAVVADIENTFLQVGLHKNLRDVTRFLWLKNLDQLSLSPENIQEYRFCRIPFGIISSPFLLGACIENHLDAYGTEIAENIKEGIYVDNLITGTSNVSDAKKLYMEAKTMFNSGSMNLREWISNNDEVNASFATCDRTGSESVKVLGHEWEIKTDTLSFVCKPTEQDDTCLSKRLVLKRVAAIFDPLGLICPVTLRGKVFLQDLWSKKLQWDDILGSADFNKWNSIKRDLFEIAKCRVPRCVLNASSEDGIEYRLLCFCDASEKAYTTTIYLHQSSSSKICIANLVFAKSRLAPVKRLSIPRLELLAVLIGQRCLKFVEKELKQHIVKSYLWADSQCVLNWIVSSKQLSVFVRNKVDEIKKSPNVSISYVQTAGNPVDIATRGKTAGKLLQCELWWNGPVWLKASRDSWPDFDFDLDEAGKRNYESEIQKSKLKSETVLLQRQTTEVNADIEEKPPFDLKADIFSSFSKLLRVTAYALRFVQKLRKRRMRSGHITSDELKEAEQMWLLHVQKKHFKDVLNAIQEDKMYLDRSGLLRCKGRLENAGLSECARCPVLLPKADRVSYLLIEKAHKELLHSGVSQTLSAIRFKNWIPHGRTTVKKVLKSCVVCHRFKSGSYKTPPLCFLPKSRVTDSCPFSYVGLDYLGPVNIKVTDGLIKTWICLFTCLVTRAVHLEVVGDMSTEGFLLCFRRFVATRGTPRKIISDNAMQFRSASGVLRDIRQVLCQNNDVQNYVSSAGINWTFNVELAPWMGVFYERLVGLVKRSMRKNYWQKNPHASSTSSSQ